MQRFRKVSIFHLLSSGIGAPHGCRHRRQERAYSREIALSAVGKWSHYCEATGLLLPVGKPRQCGSLGLDADGQFSPKVSCWLLRRTGC
jgi:hypothetical protein